MGERVPASGQRLVWATLFPVMFRELSESTGSECLGSMTPETQDIYLRMDHHRRRSGYRLGRIIARQQLLKRITGGRRRLWTEVTLQTFGLMVGDQPCFLALTEELKSSDFCLNVCFFVILAETQEGTVTKI